MTQVKQPQNPESKPQNNAALRLAVALPLMLVWNGVIATDFLVTLPIFRQGVITIMVAGLTLILTLCCHYVRQARPIICKNMEQFTALRRWLHLFSMVNVILIIIALLRLTF